VRIAAVIGSDEQAHTARIYPKPFDLIRSFLNHSLDELIEQQALSVKGPSRRFAPRSLWQNGIAERLIGSVRRECLDHVSVFGG
jgi:hypothetical protein